MVEKQKVLLKRSSVPGKMPSEITSGTVELGELFINIASGDADNFLTTLRAEGSSAVTSDYIKWSDDVANEKKFATKEEVMDNELVVSTIITKINESVGLDENSDSVLPNGESLSEAIIALQNKAQDMEESDPIFTESAAASITSEDISNWNNKLGKTEKAASAKTSDSAITSVSASTVSFSGIPTGKTSTTVARGDHSHTPAELGLESALKYHGVTTTPLTDGATTKPITIGGVSHYQSAGCVVIYSTTASGDTEFVWNGSSWEKLGDGVNYKVKQTAVSSPSANGNATSFIDTISQDANGVITATKKNITTASTSNLGLMKVGNFLTSNGGTVSVSTGTSNTTVARGNHTHANYALASDLNSLIEDIEDNEYVVANALTQINLAAGFTEAGVSQLPGGQSLTDAILELQDSDNSNYAILTGTNTFTSTNNFKNGINVSGSTNISGTTNIKGTTTISGTTNMKGSTTISGTVNVNMVSGNIITPANDNMGIIPQTNNFGQIGASDKYFYRMYASTFYGSLSGSATSATTSVSAITAKSASTVSFSGIPTGKTSTTVARGDHGHTGYASSTHYHNFSDITGGTLSLSGDIYTDKITYGSNNLSFYYGNNKNMVLSYANNYSKLNVQDLSAGRLFLPPANFSNDSVVTGFTLDIHDSFGSKMGSFETGGNLYLDGYVSCDSISNTTKFYSSTGSGKYYLLGTTGSSNSSTSILMKNSNVYMDSGDLYAASDKRLKTHIGNVNGDPELIKQIPKVYFHWNDDKDKKSHLGTYAQNVEEIYPELVTKDDEGIRGVAYDRMGVVALAGIDKLYEMIQELQTKNEELEKRIKDLENKN